MVGAIVSAALPVIKGLKIKVKGKGTDHYSVWQNMDHIFQAYGETVKQGKSAIHKFAVINGKGSTTSAAYLIDKYTGICYYSLEKNTAGGAILANKDYQFYEREKNARKSGERITGDYMLAIECVPKEAFQGVIEVKAENLTLDIRTLKTLGIYDKVMNAYKQGASIALPKDTVKISTPVTGSNPQPVKNPSPVPNEKEKITVTTPIFDVDLETDKNAKDNLPIKVIPTPQLTEEPVKSGMDFKIILLVGIGLFILLKGKI